MPTRFNVTPATTGLEGPLWRQVNQALETDDVDVVFAAGRYRLANTVTLRNIGHHSNVLTIRSASNRRVELSGRLGTLFSIVQCHNLVVNGLSLTGRCSSYALKISNSKNVQVTNCSFTDLSMARYGAIGVTNDTTDGVTVRNCSFARVGFDSHAHMIYGAYGVKRLRVVDNSFEDCSGSYVRFRGDQSDYGVVFGNRFVSTGTYAGGVNRVFVEIPVFNNVNPGDERFGTHFMISNNVFNYSDRGGQQTRFALCFHHSGYNPSGRRHLITRDQALVLGSGSVNERRRIMLNALGLIGSEIRFGRNTNNNVEKNVVYRCHNNYGSNGPWSGVVSIGTAVNTRGLATNASEALSYYALD